MDKMELSQPVTDEENESCCSVFKEKNELSEKIAIKPEIKFYVARLTEVK